MMLRSLRLSALLTLLAATPALAAESGGLLSPEPGLIIWTILIFLIVLAILYRAAYPKILGVVEAREQHIRELLAAAARDREEAHALLEEQKRQMEEVRAKAQEAVAEGRAAGERVREEIAAQARREHEEMLGRARREIRQEMEVAADQLRAETVELAIAAASRLIGRNLDQEDNRRLVRDFLAQVESRGDAVPAGV